MWKFLWALGDRGPRPVPRSHQNVACRTIIGFRRFFPLPRDEPHNGREVLCANSQLVPPLVHVEPRGSAPCQRQRKADNRSCGGSAPMGSEEDEAKLLQEAKSLPFAERLTHKHWKVRSEAYLDVTKEAVWAENVTGGILKEFGACCITVTCISLHAGNTRSWF